jgi:serine/threonine protein kinase
MSLSNEEFENVACAEVAILEMIRNLNHAHLIKAIAYYKKGTKHCVIFPWARHGNLRDFWRKEPPELSQRYLSWVFTQLCGLAGAIERLHHSHQEQATRHGDLKPENILCFDTKDDSSDEQDECILVIADVGLSKCHDKLTELRNDATRTSSGTIMYEPPETELQPREPRSRRYDVWSLGCIYLEFIVWLLYGAQELAHFRQDLSVMGKNTRFYTIEETNGTQGKVARLNIVVEKWINWIRKDPRCPEGTAVRSLVELVVMRMLIADVSCVPRSISCRTFPISRMDSAPISPDPSTPSFNFRPPTIVGNFEPNNDLSTRSRATAREVYNQMKMISGKVTSTTDKRFGWMIWGLPPQQGPRQYGNLLDPSDRRNAKDAEVR